MRRRSIEDKLLHPEPGSRIAEARDYGIDLSQIVENLRLSPAERIRANDQAINSVSKFEEAMRRAKAAARAKK